MTKAGKWLWRELRDLPGVDKVDPTELRVGDRPIGDRATVTAVEVTYLQKLGVEKPGKPHNSDKITERPIRRAGPIEALTHDCFDERIGALGAQCTIGGKHPDAVFVPYTDAVLIVRT